MTRQLPSVWQNQPPPELGRVETAPQLHVRSYRLISPLFGGGVEPQQADPISTVRASEVRGQLRFWWRATRAGRYGADGLQAMKQAEDQLWGSTEAQSLVEIEVRNTNSGSEVATYAGQGGRTPHVGDPASPLSYAAFPLRSTESRAGGRSRSSGGLHFGVSFDLVVALPQGADLRDDIIAALWAWETFGGVGARTRRGFGALQCDGVRGATDIGPWLPPSGETTATAAWLREQLANYVLPGVAPRGVPQLAREIVPTVARNQRVGAFADRFEDRVRHVLATGGFADSIPDALLRALVVWYYPIDKLKEFRQSRRGNTGSGHFGRSFWPEPDEIRWRFPNGFRGRHSDPVSATKRRTNKFPRAAFGLPIVFQFKDNELPNTTLQGAKHDRLASRLILRPLACADGRYVSVATVLVAPSLPPEGLRLKDANDEIGIVTEPLSASEANFRPLNGRGDVLEAFLDTL